MSSIYSLPPPQANRSLPKLTLLLHSLMFLITFFFCAPCMCLVTVAEEVEINLFSREECRALNTTVTG